MQTASQLTKPIAVEFITEDDPEIEHSRFEVFEEPGHTNTSCDFCGTFGLVATRSCTTAEDHNVLLICSDCEQP